MTSPSIPRNTLHMIGNAHIDPVWLWRWQEGCHEVIATFRSAIERMDEDPDFRFTASSAAFYEWVEHLDPPLFRQIQARVAEGRWEIVGGWWVEPDCNLPSGESFVRQALYAQHYFREKFGHAATVGFAPDSFGHNGMLPQLLAKSGLTSYVFMRPHPHEQGLPARLFWWTSDDGSRVLAYRLPYEYVTWGDELTAHIRRCNAELQPPYDELAVFYGVGNHGGGPTRGNLLNIRRMATEAENDPAAPRLRFSTMGEFFAAVQAKDWPLPTVQHDLQHHAPGCYAVHSRLKALNRRAETRLMAAETFSALAAWLTDHPYPREAFTTAWKGVLFNQFHDILAGTSLQSACDDAETSYHEAISIAERTLNAAMQRLAWAVNIPLEPARTPVIVFNPHGWAVSTPVEVEFNPLPVGAGTQADVVADADGTPVPSQKIQPHATTTWRRRVVFQASLPPLGYRVYYLQAGEPAQLENTLHATDTTLENSLLRLEVDPATGGLRVYDKGHGFDVFSAPAAPYALHDDSDTWGHDVVRYGGDFQPFQTERVHLLEHGAVRVSLRILSRYHDSRLTQIITLYPDRRQIDVRVSLDWREQHTLLKWRFPLALTFLRPTYEIPYGHIERPTDGAEEPGQRWIDVSGVVQKTMALYGVSLLNDSKYSFAVAGNIMEMTALRSPIYAHHIPAQPSPDGEYAYIDQGVQTFAFSLLPHPDSWQEAETARRAAELNQPPLTLLGTYHAGTLPLSWAGAEVDATNINIGAVKLAEDGDDLIIRLVETAKRETTATLRLPAWERTIPLHFTPCEIKTLRIPRAADHPATEVNLIEWNVDEPAVP